MGEVGTFRLGAPVGPVGGPTGTGRRTSRRRPAAVVAAGRVGSAGVADQPEATAWLGCGAIGKALYCAGGGDSTTPSVHTHSYDPATCAWSPLADMPFAGSPRHP